MERPPCVHHWGTNDHRTTGGYTAAHFHLCFPSRCFHAGDVRLSLCFVFREGHPASILLPCGASPFRQPPSRPLTPPLFLLLPQAPVRQGASSCSHSTLDHFTQLASSQHLHLIKVTPAYRYSCLTHGLYYICSFTHLSQLQTHNQNSLVGKQHSELQLFGKLMKRSGEHKCI